MSANDPMLRDDGDRALGSFLGHLVLYEPNDRCDDRSSDAAAHRLTEKSTNIHAAGCITQHRQKRGEDLTYDATSNCARDSVATVPRLMSFDAAPAALPPSAPATI